MTAAHPQMSSTNSQADQQAVADGLDLSIIVVDDAQFSSTLVSRELNAAGFRDVRMARCAEDALEANRQRPADIFISDWMMPSMDGLALTRLLRRSDHEVGRYTYMLLLTGREEPSALADAFAAGVDDFVEKSLVRTALIPRLNAGIRIMLRQRHLQERVDDLDARLRILETSRGIDGLTGLGDRDTAIDALSRTIRQVSARGGAACVLTLGLQDPEGLQEEHGEEIHAEIIQSIALRLTQLVRPLDVITHPGEDMFMVIMHHADLSQCNVTSFKRITDAIDMRSFETSEGFVTVPVAMAVTAADVEHTSLPDPLPFFAHAEESLAQARSSGAIEVCHWKSPDIEPGKL